MNPIPPSGSQPFGPFEETTSYPHGTAIYRSFQKVQEALNKLADASLPSHSMFEISGQTPLTKALDDLGKACTDLQADAQSTAAKPPLTNKETSTLTNLQTQFENLKTTYSDSGDNMNMSQKQLDDIRQNFQNALNAAQNICIKTTLSS